MSGNGCVRVAADMEVTMDIERTVSRDPDLGGGRCVEADGAKCTTEMSMDLADFDFVFRQEADARPVTCVSPLGVLEDLKGRWEGTGLNVIWRPNGAPTSDHFLELNQTTEIFQFDEIPGPIKNRGLLQPDICMFGLSYLQIVFDLNDKDPTTGKPVGLHFEPGIWATVPATQHPNLGPTVVRMAVIPHGTTVITQGTSSVAIQPTIPDISITPFLIGDAAKRQAISTSNLSQPSQFRTPDPANRFRQEMVDNPNLVLRAGLMGKKVTKTITLNVSSSAGFPVPGGGVANTAFLQGSPDEGPNAKTGLVSTTFWIETIEGAAGAPDVLQLQYSQLVLLNFAKLSWPHVSVATLQKVPTAQQFPQATAP
jgi:hypothetical protein